MNLQKHKVLVETLNFAHESSVLVLKHFKMYLYAGRVELYFQLLTVHCFPFKYNFV